MAIINFNSISGVSTISVASSITVGNNVSIGTDRVTATTFSGNLTGNVTGTVNSSGIATFSNGLVVSAGTTAAPSITPTGDSNTGIFFPAADTIAFAEGGVEALRIDSSSNVGIGTAVPSQKLEVVGGEIKAGRVDSTNEGGQVSFGRATDNATGWYIDVYGNTSTPSLRFVDVSNGVVRATIDGSGRMTLPYQPAFRATFSTSYTVAVNTEMVPSTIVTNIGSHYSNTTGRFTAPVAGMYHFSFNVRFNAVSYYNFTFRLNGNITSYYESVGSASVSTNDGYSNSIYLNAGDYVSLFNGSTGGLSSDSFASFSGFLIG